MTVEQLQQALTRLINEGLGDAEVNYGPDFKAVGGGIKARHQKTGVWVLNLAPIALDQIEGGF